MALHFNELVVETTYHCNAQCGHCYTSCGPTAPKDLLSPEVAMKAIADAATDDRIDPQLTFAGGEATLYREHLLRLVEHGAQHGFRINLVTNGFWGLPRDRGRALAAELASAGLSRLEISTDGFHEPYISYEAVGAAAEAAKDVGLDVNLRLAVTDSVRIGDILARLGGADLSRVMVLPQPASPTGAGRRIPAEDVLYVDDQLPSGNCSDLLNLTITPTGEVYPCCAGSELTESLRLGNCGETPLPEILDAAERNLLARKLICFGPTRLLENLSPSVRDRIQADRYLNICHLCTRLFTDAEATAELERAAHAEKADKVRASVQELLHRMTAQAAQPTQ